MNIDTALLSVPVHRSSLGTEYIFMDDVPSPWREQCWEHLGQQNAQLMVEGVRPGALMRDWRPWVESRSA